MGCPTSPERLLSAAASASRLSRAYTVPTGLLGESMMMAAVRSLMAAATAGTSIWKVSASAMTSTQVQPQVSIHTRYSGKYGAMTMTSSPRLVTACSVMESDAAAPQVT